MSDEITASAAAEAAASAAGEATTGERALALARGPAGTEGAGYARLQLTDGAGRWPDLPPLSRVKADLAEDGVGDAPPPSSDEDGAESARESVGGSDERSADGGEVENDGGEEGKYLRHGQERRPGLEGKP